MMVTNGRQPVAPVRRCNLILLSLGWILPYPRVWPRPPHLPADLDAPLVSLPLRPSNFSLGYKAGTARVEKYCELVRDQIYHLNIVGFETRSVRQGFMFGKPENK
ncbi:unnamed protein product [Ectocarpus sp. 12 AP-2014]